jgi:hypothetical protein
MTYLRQQFDPSMELTLVGVFPPTEGSKRSAPETGMIHNLFCDMCIIYLRVRYRANCK